MSEFRTRDTPRLHLLKLCVGADSVEDVVDWQRGLAIELGRTIGDPRPRHRTRMTPKRGDELLAGGSLYWVIRGLVRCRQRLLALEPVEVEGVGYVDLVLDPEVSPTVPQPRRPFQGWRYLDPKDAPADLSRGAAADLGHLPEPLAQALADIGLR